MLCYWRCFFFFLEGVVHEAMVIEKNNQKWRKVEMIKKRVFFRYQQVKGSHSCCSSCEVLKVPKEERLFFFFFFFVMRGVKLDVLWSCHAKNKFWWRQLLHRHAEPCHLFHMSPRGPYQRRETNNWKEHTNSRMQKWMVTFINGTKGGGERVLVLFNPPCSRVQCWWWC